MLRAEREDGAARGGPPPRDAHLGHLRLLRQRAGAAAHPGKEKIIQHHFFVKLRIILTFAYHNVPPIFLCSRLICQVSPLRLT